MKIPKYVIELMERATYNFEKELKGFEVGYTIDIPKATYCTSIRTHENEITSLLKWVKREYTKMGGSDEHGEIAYINYIPSRTKYVMQHITVTILDPVMKFIEPYMQEERKY